MEQQEQTQQPFGSLLRTHRTTAGLTQEQLAERAGLSRRGIADLERGARLVPYPHTIERLAQGLGLSAEEHASLLVAARGQRRSNPRARRSRRPEAIAKPEPRTNLPHRPNLFVGRHAERTRLASLLESLALVTLVGAGGVGKTRLGLEVAANQIQRWRDGVWLVELSAIAEAEMVPRAVGAVLGVPQLPGREAIDNVIDWLRDKTLLLVLDNCEHIANACAQLVAQLLRNCPGVHLLVTSREVLGVEGETIWRVDPLGVPDATTVAVSKARESESVRLFAARAAAAVPDFVLTDGNAAAVREICRRLDGLPLALELTAARLRVLSVDDIAHRLDQRFDLLTGGTRDALPRHRALRALVDWSYDLLDSSERELFKQLSVFAGGWSLDAAEAVCTLPPAVTLDTLGRLVDKSLVRTEPLPDGSMRYSMLETLRGYAADRLRSSHKADAVNRRHALFYADAVTHWYGEVWWGRDTQARLARIATDYANMGSSARWLIEHGEVEAAQRQAASLTFFWVLQGWVQDGFAWLREVLDLTDSTAEASAARFGALVGLSLMLQSDRPTTLANLEVEVPKCRELADAITLTLALMQVGRLTWLVRHDLETARSFLEEAMCVATATPFQPLQALVRTHFGSFLYETGEYASAEHLLEENLQAGGAFESYFSEDKLLLGWVRIAQGHHAAAATLIELVLNEPFTVRSPHWTVLTLTALSWARLALHDVVAAISAAKRGLTLVREHLGRGMTQGWLGGPLEAFAEIASATGQHPRALRLAAAAGTFRDISAIRISPSERELLTRWMTRSRLALGAAVSEQHAAEGRGMTPEAAIAEALAVEAIPVIDGARDGLTPRERQVLPLIARGLTNREIGRELAIAEGTARIHVERVLGKLGLRSRTQLAVRYAGSGAGVCLSADVNAQAQV